MAFEHAQNNIELLLAHPPQEWQLHFGELGAEMTRKIADRHAPGLVNSSGATGKRNVLEVGRALETLVARDEDFPAPYVAVRAVTSTVEGKPDHLSFEMVLRHATGDMGMVMLHADQRQAGPLPRPLGRKVVRMEIVCNEL